MTAGSRIAGRSPSSPAARAWQRMLSGRRLDLLDPSPLDIEIADIADRLRLAALLHDAPEYVIGDMISPFKAVLGDSYKSVEKRLLAAIHIRFSLPAELGPEIERQIKAADRGAAYLEATRLAGFAEAEAKRLFGRDPGLSEAAEQDYLTPWSAAKAEKRFLARFNTVQGAPTDASHG